MFNDRPIDDPRLQAALDEVLAVYRKYDLAGACMLVNEEEAAFAYPIYTTWNAVVEDASVPMGFRIRVKEAEQGPEPRPRPDARHGAPVLSTEGFWRANAGVDAGSVTDAAKKWYPVYASPV